MDPIVTKVHSKEVRWQAEFRALRQLCLASGLHEELKWGQACYDLEGKNVVLFHGFKNYCALLFLKGVLLNDPKGILLTSSPTSACGCRLRGKEGDCYGAAR